MKYFVWIEFMAGFILALYGLDGDNPWMTFPGLFLVSSAVLYIADAVYGKKEQK